MKTLRERVEENLGSVISEKTGTALIFSIRDKKDYFKFKKIINNSDFSAEEYDRGQYLSFEEDESSIDALEMAIQKLADKSNISGSFEVE